MSGTRTPRECPSLLALFEAGEAAEDDALVAEAIAAHVASCPTCARAEAALASLVTGYRRAESSSLPDEVELRLLDQLCPLTTPRSMPEG